MKAREWKKAVQEKIRELEQRRHELDVELEFRAADLEAKKRRCDFTIEILDALLATDASDPTEEGEDPESAVDPAEDLEAEF